MSVLLDANILSLALRRNTPNPAIRLHLDSLLRAKSAFIIGAVRQELLSGLPTPSHYDALRTQLGSVPVLPTMIDDHDLAAHYFNVCRWAGVQGHPHDFLLCAISTRLTLPLWTFDRDFLNFSPHIPVSLYTLPT